MSYNSVTLMGRLGQDPELKHFPNGGQVCNLSLATTETWNDKTSGQKQERTSWHKVKVFGKMADVCSTHLSKGSQCLVGGSISYSSYEDKDGNKRYTTEIKATTVRFIGGASNFSQSEPENKPAQDYNISTDANYASSDIPF